MRGRRPAIGHLLGSVVAVVVAIGTVAVTARAHGETVETPPIPIPVLLGGAALAVGGTAVVLAYGPTPPTGRFRLGSVQDRTVTWITRAVRAVVVIVLGASLVSGLTERAAVSLAEIVVWPLLLKGTLLVAALVGSPWRVIAPWEIIYDALAAIEGRELALGTYPARARAWPAVLGVLALVGVVENLTVIPTSGRLTIAVLAAYTLVMVAGAVAFGREFFERADALTVLYALVGRVAAISIEPDHDTSNATPGQPGRVAVFARPPWTSSSRALADRSEAVVVVAAVATVTFDGVVETVVAGRVLADLEPVVGAFAGVTLYAAFLAVFLAGAVLVHRGVIVAAGDAERAGSLATHLAGTLLPIAVAYDVAHNYPYVLVNVTRAVTRATTALGGSVTLDATALLPPVAVWTTQVGLVLGGHLVAVVAAHLATERVFPDRRRARRGHAPIAVLMIAYTVGSLYILAAP